MDEAPPIAPPVTWTEVQGGATGIPVPGAPGVFFARMWPRFAAYLVDGVLLVLLNGVVLLIVGAAAPAAATLEALSTVSGVASLATALLTAAYFILQWRGGQRATLGMRAVGIQIGNAFNGVRLTGRQALLRWALFGYPLGVVAIVPVLSRPAALVELVLTFALFVTTLGSPTRQGWHDQVANSAVVRRPGASGSNTSAIIIVVVVGVLVIIGLFAFLSLIFLGSAISVIPLIGGSSI